MLARYSITPAQLARKRAKYLRSILRWGFGGSTLKDAADDLLDGGLLDSEIGDGQLRQQARRDAGCLVASDQQFGVLPVDAAHFAIRCQAKPVRGQRKVDTEQLVRRD